MYEINPIKEDGYEASYIYKSKNIAGQIIHLNIFLCDYRYFWVIFYITTKRRNGFQEGKQTGKDGIKSLIWAKNCVLHFIETKRRLHHGKKLFIQGADKRRYSVYKRSLEPLGFTEILDGTNTLMIEL